MQLKQEQILKPSTPFNSNIFTWQKRIKAEQKIGDTQIWLAALKEGKYYHKNI